MMPAYDAAVLLEQHASGQRISTAVQVEEAMEAVNAAGLWPSMSDAATAYWQHFLHTGEHLEQVRQMGLLYEQLLHASRYAHHAAAEACHWANCVEDTQAYMAWLQAKQAPWARIGEVRLALHHYEVQAAGAEGVRTLADTTLDNILHQWKKELDTHDVHD